MRIVAASLARVSPPKSDPSYMTYVSLDENWTFYTFFAFNIVRRAAQNAARRPPRPSPPRAPCDPPPPSSSSSPSRSPRCSLAAPTPPRTPPATPPSRRRTASSTKAATAWRPTLAFAPLRARRPSRPPKTRARTRNGPTTPITRLRSGTTTRFTWYIYKVNSGRSALDKQDACDSVIHDFLIASVKTCVQGFSLAALTSTDIDQLYYCTGGGGTDGSTCRRQVPGLHRHHGHDLRCRRKLQRRRRGRQV